jgi:hypothetical protein
VVVKAEEEKGVAEESSTFELGKEDGSTTPVAIANRIGAAEPIQIRDRIKELRRIRARELLPHPKNWRRHPQAQVAALRGLLDEIGYADAVLARELPDGRLMLIDGHLRKETTPDAQIPVLVVDVTEAEAEKILATLDPLAAMAESDSERIKALVATVQTKAGRCKICLSALLATVFGKFFIRRMSKRLRSPLTGPMSYGSNGAPKLASFGRSGRTGSSAATAKGGRR